MQWVFWGSLILVVYTYIGYAALLALVSTVKSRWFRREVVVEGGSFQPSVSVVMVVHNEESRIKVRLENLLQSDYGMLQEVLVICDRCDDDTARLAEEAGSCVKSVDLLEGKKGKAAGVNQGVLMASGEIVVLVDVRQRFAEDTISHLVAAFVDEEVGAVSGSLEIESSNQVAGEGLDVYWELEKFIRRKEAEIASSIGCTGAVYALRRKVYQPIAEDTILDDVVIPMKIALAGKRVLFDAEAKAYDPQSLDRASEQRRKVRTLAGNWQMLFRHLGWLLPWRNPLLWQLVSHKYLRLLGPVFLLVALLCNLMLFDDGWFYWITFLWQVLCYSLGIAGMFELSFLWKPLKVLAKISSGFLFLQILCVLAFFRWMKGRSRVGGW
ncbi:MAG: glycosyltransferase family 2 protein [Verrucomicrobiales bacterium]|nr:glycosyltransferase family 2 protein [Verrucomicrobiales bacterium]